MSASDQPASRSEASAAGELESLFCDREALVDSHGLDEIVAATVAMARDRVSSQTASLFLVTKDGELERRLIAGIDRRGEPIRDDMFPAECHKPGSSLTGQVLCPGPSPMLGRPRWTNSLASSSIDSENWSRYTAVLGELHSIIAMPVNGRHSMYGVIEVINKLPADGASSPGFSWTDVCRLLNIANSAATALSIMRRRMELLLLSKLSRSLVGSYEAQNQVGLYDAVLRSLVGDLTSYKSAVLSFSDGANGASTFFARADKRDSAELPFETPPTPDPFAERARATRQREVVPSLSECTEHPEVCDWAKKHDLRSCLYLPLVAGTEVFGTLAVYTGFPYSFTDITSLESLGSLLASFLASARLIKQLNQAESEVSRQRELQFAASRAVTLRLSDEDRLHAVKGMLQTAQGELQSIAGLSSGPKQERHISALSETLRLALESAKSYIVGSARRTLNLNHVVQSVLSLFRLELQRHGIALQPAYGNPLPALNADESEIREIVFNLLSNAIKAVERAGRPGRIAVQTSTVEVGDIVNVELVVEDNGTGIPNEVFERLFEKYFTTTPETGGTGLGLFLVRRLVRGEYGGTVHAESTVGKGSRFVVRLPCTS